MCSIIFVSCAFAHETKIMAKSAIKANDYNQAVTFIVLQLKMRTCWIKTKQRCAHHPMEPRAVIWAAININYTSTTKQMWEKWCCGGVHLSPLWLFLLFVRWLSKRIREDTDKKTCPSLRVQLDNNMKRSEKVECTYRTKYLIVLES